MGGAMVNIYVYLTEKKRKGEATRILIVVRKICLTPDRKVVTFYGVQTNSRGFEGSCLLVTPLSSSSSLFLVW